MKKYSKKNFFGLPDLLDSVFYPKTRHLSLIRNTYVSNEHKIVVFWTQKSACGAVANWFSHNVINKPMTRESLRMSHYCISFKEALKLIKNEDYTTIYFCRDPYSRVVSAYLNKFYFHPYSGVHDSYESLEIFSKELVEETGATDPYVGLSFNLFLKTVQKMMEQSISINRHWDTQFPRQSDNKFTSNFIVHQEKFNDDLSIVNKSLGLNDYHPKKTNSTNYDKTFVFSDALFDNVSSLDILKQRIALSKSNLLTEESRKLIADIYKLDFEYFGYTI